MALPVTRTPISGYLRVSNGVIFLDQLQLFATHRNQWDCFIFYRQQITSNVFFVFVKVGKGRLSGKDERFRNKKSCNSLFLYYIKQVDSMLPCVCSVIDHRGRQNVVRTSVTHSDIASSDTVVWHVCGVIQLISQIVMVMLRNSLYSYRM